MSGLDQPNMEHYAYEQAAEFNYYLCMIMIILLIATDILLFLSFSKTKLDIWHLTRGSSTI